MLIEKVLLDDKDYRLASGLLGGLEVTSKWAGRTVKCAKGERLYFLDLVEALEKTHGWAITPDNPDFAIVCRDFCSSMARPGQAAWGAYFQHDTPQEMAAEYARHYRHEDNQESPLGADDTSEPRPKVGPFVFKNAEAAFEYACKYLDTRIRPDAGFFGLVIDPDKPDDPPVLVKDSGIQGCMMKIATSDGGMIVFSETAGSKGPKLEVGDGVVWRPMVGVGRIWTGLIVAKVEPTLSLTEGWKVLGYFDE